MPGRSRLRIPSAALLAASCCFGDAAAWTSASMVMTAREAREAVVAGGNDELHASLMLLQHHAGGMSSKEPLPAGIVGFSNDNHEPTDVGPNQGEASKYLFTESVEATEDLKKACQDCEVKRNPWVQQERQCGVMWFYHIPKCGGESVNWWLFRMKEQKELDDVLLLHSMDKTLDFNTFVDSQLEPVLKDAKGKLVAVHHHDRGPGLYGLEDSLNSMKMRLQSQGCDLYLFSFVKEPKSLLRSTMVFYDSAEHQQGLEWVSPDPVRNITDPSERFKVAMETDAIYDNLMVRYILNNRLENDGPNPRDAGGKYPMKIGEVDKTALGMAWGILSKFDYVGLLDDLEAGLYEISTDVGFGSVVGLKPQNVYGFDQANMAVTTRQSDFDSLMSSGQVDMLVEQRTSIDKILYDAVSSLQDARRSASSWSAVASGVDITSGNIAAH